MYVLFIVLAITAGPNAMSTSQIQFKTKALCDQAAKDFSDASMPQYVHGAVQCFKVK